MKTEYRKLQETGSRCGERRGRNVQNGGCGGRASCGSSFLGHPDAKFFCAERGTDTKQEETEQKERTAAFGGTHDQ